MKIRILLFSLAFILSNGLLFAQVQEVSVGPAYTQQAYYSFSTGETQVISNDAWDIAFTNQGGQDAGVLINESGSLGGETLSLFLSASTEWADTIIDDGQFVDSLRLYNTEDSWSEGAFNSIKDTADVFDYGWGAYNPTSHAVEGSKVFVIKLRNGDLKKFQVTDLTSGTYSFRYANLDGSEEIVSAISKSSDSNQALMLYSLSTGEEVDFPSDFDLVFQRYTTDLDAGDGTTVSYTVTGVLSGPNVEVAEASGVDPTTVNEGDYSEEYVSDLTAIGHDWKSFDFALGWVINQELAYFVKTASGEKYKLVFYDFEGSSTGTVTFEITEVISSSVQSQFTSDSRIEIYPNPFVNHISIGTDSAISTNYQFFDISGKVLMTGSFVGTKDLQLGHLSDGPYVLRLIQGDVITTRRIVKH